MHETPRKEIKCWGQRPRCPATNPGKKFAIFWEGLLAIDFDAAREVADYVY